MIKIAYDPPGREEASIRNGILGQGKSFLFEHSRIYLAFHTNPEGQSSHMYIFFEIYVRALESVVEIG